MTAQQHTADQAWQPNSSCRDLATHGQKLTTFNEQKPGSAELHRLHQQSNPITSADTLLERIRQPRRHSPDGNPHSHICADSAAAAAVATHDTISRSSIPHVAVQSDDAQPYEGSDVSKSPQVQSSRLTACDHSQKDAVLASIQARRQHATTETSPIVMHTHHHAVLHWLQQSFCDKSQQQAESNQLSTAHSGDTSEREDGNVVLPDHAVVVPEVHDCDDLSPSLSASKLYSCCLRLMCVGTVVSHCSCVKMSWC